MPKQVSASEVDIEGEWSLPHAEARLDFLRGELDRLSRRKSCEPVTVELSGMTAVDPCGCQLLLLFRENLRRRGIAASFAPPAGPAALKIRALGYQGLLEGDAP